MVTIPHNRVNFGIRACLRNSKRISLESSRILKRDAYLSLVLYYYAVEEFGKALLLEELKNKSRNGKGFSVDLQNHSTKLKQIQTKHKDLLIKRLEIDHSKSYSGINKNKKIVVDFLRQSKDDIFNIDNISTERTSLWLVDYNEKSKHWNEHDLIQDDDIRSKNIVLRKKIKKMLNQYSNLK